MKKLIFITTLFLSALGISAQTDSTAAADTSIQQFAEEMPEFIGEEGEIQKFIAKNLVYPKKAIKKGIQGTVFLQFIVEKDGSLSNLKVVKGIGYGCDEEVIRVMKMAKFTPGTQKGKPVRVRMGMPVNFKLK